LEGMRLLISGWGCEVAALDCRADVMASDGRDGPPDIVIADYHLCDGTGIAAILHLRRQFGADIPAWLITADRTPEVRSEAERYGSAVQH
ncbi:response regulator, partial [Rhizobium ruizarguesonis]